MDAQALFVTRPSAADADPAGLALGVGSLAIGVAALVVPRLVSRVMKVDRSAVWVIAVRDLASAWLILGWGGRLAYLTRALFDLGDAGMMARRRPAAALLAAVTSLVAIRAALATSDPPQGR